MTAQVGSGRESSSSRQLAKNPDYAHCPLGGELECNGLVATIIRVRSWVCSHVKLVFVFVGYSEPMLLARKGFCLRPV
jgi:hypothetical protein